MHAERVWVVSVATIVGHVISSDHVDEREDVGDAAGVKPYRPVVARYVGHPVGGGGASLSRKLHVALDLTNVRDNFRVGDDVAGRLVAE